jgi:hypothetical protein
MTGFKITKGQGFHISFPNGWHVSVQFGPGTYSDHYNSEFTSGASERCGRDGSSTAEVWCLNDDAGKSWPEEDPLAYQTPEQVAAIIACAAKGDFSELSAEVGA